MKLKKHVFKNGLRLVLAPHPDSIAATVLVLVAAGSKYEQKAESGLSHFLEHMCFKGTINRPNSMAISSEFDSLGAQNNAFTSQEFTGYYATVRPKFLPKTLNLLADMYLNPIFPPAEIEKEKGVIIEEINMYEDNPSRNIHDVFMRLLYGDQPAGWNIAGTKETVRATTQKNFFDYRARHYVASGTVVVVAGAFNEREVVKAVGREFGIISAGKKHSKLKVKEKQVKPALALKFKDSDQAHLLLGFRSFSMFHPQEAALEVLAALLGGSMSARLFRRVREEMGAAYYVRASQDAYTDHGVLAAAAGVEVARAPQVVAAILEEFKLLTQELAPAAELRRVKDSLTGRLFLGLETSQEQAVFLGIQEVLKNKMEAPRAWAKKLEQVTAEELRRLARQIFQDRQLNLALIGPFKNKQPFERSLGL